LISTRFSLVVKDEELEKEAFPKIRLSSGTSWAGSAVAAETPIAMRGASSVVERACIVGTYAGFQLGWQV
jgi:hypothetical protein